MINRLVLPIAVSFVAGLFAACASDDPARNPPDSRAGASAAGAPSDQEAGASQGGTLSSDEPALYAIATAVSSDSGASTYVKLFGRFEQELELSRAREFAGWSDMATVGPYLFVSSGEGPTVQRFTFASGVLEDAGEIGFGNHVDDANFYNQTVVSETKAYLAGDGEYVVWNPSTLAITGTIPFPELPDRDNVHPMFALDRAAVVRGKRLYHTVAWSDTTELSFMPDSRIVVLDTETDEVVDVIEAPCPDLFVADRDEAGNLYFSNWVYTPGSTLLKGGAPACAVRIPAGSEKLDDWRLDYSENTGNEGAVLNYLGDDKWMLSSFLNDLSRYDPDEDWFDWLFGDTWELRTFDPGSKVSASIAGLPKNGGGYYAQRFDGAMHVLIPGDSYSTTSLYAIDPSGGPARQEMHMMGWATRVFKLR